MAGSRGYHSYHGRTPKWKVILAVILVLVILAAVGVIALQKYVVYDETGTPHLRLPVEEGAPPQKEDSVEFTIEAAAALQKIYGISLTEKPLTLAAAVPAEETPYNAVAVTLKDPSGAVYFDASSAVSGAVELSPDTGEALQKLTQAPGRYTIARVSCFRDSKAANHSVEEMGLKNTGGYIFYDGNNEQWLSPAKSAARQYLCALAKEIAALGFDELLLTDVSYPTEGKLDKIDYGEGNRADELQTFFDELRTALEPYHVTVSVEVPEAAITAGMDGDLTLAEIAAKADRIYARTESARVDALTASVAAAGKAEFVPELSTAAEDLQGSCLIVETP